MAKISQNEKNEKLVNNGVSHGKRSAKINKYFEIIRENPTLPRMEAAKRAGYSDNSGNTINAIESTVVFKTLWEEQQRLVESLKKPIEQRIHEAQERTGFCAELALRRIRQVCSRGKDRDAIAAGKVGTEITGERMPEQYDYNVTGDSTILTRLMQ